MRNKRPPDSDSTTTEPEIVIDFEDGIFNIDAVEAYPFVEDSPFAPSLIRPAFFATGADTTSTFSYTGAAILGAVPVVEESAVVETCSGAVAVAEQEVGGARSTISAEQKRAGAPGAEKVVVPATELASEQLVVKGTSSSTELASEQLVVKPTALPPSSAQRGPVFRGRLRENGQSSCPLSEASTPANSPKRTTSPSKRSEKRAVKFVLSGPLNTARRRVGVTGGQPPEGGAQPPPTPRVFNRAYQKQLLKAIPEERMASPPAARSRAGSKENHQQHSSSPGDHPQGSFTGPPAGIGGIGVVLVPASPPSTIILNKPRPAAPIPSPRSKSPEKKSPRKELLAPHPSVVGDSRDSRESPTTDGSGASILGSGRSLDGGGRGEMDQQHPPPHTRRGSYARRGSNVSVASTGSSSRLRSTQPSGINRELGPVDDVEDVLEQSSVGGGFIQQSPLQLQQSLQQSPLQLPLPTSRTLVEEETLFPDNRRGRRAAARAATKNSSKIALLQASPLLTARPTHKADAEPASQIPALASTAAPADSSSGVHRPPRPPALASQIPTLAPLRSSSVQRATDGPPILGSIAEPATAASPNLHPTTPFLLPSPNLHSSQLPAPPSHPPNEPPTTSPVSGFATLLSSEASYFGQTKRRRKPQNKRAGHRVQASAGPKGSLGVGTEGSLLNSTRAKLAEKRVEGFLKKVRAQKLAGLTKVDAFDVHKNLKRICEGAQLKPEQEKEIMRRVGIGVLVFFASSGRTSLLGL